MPWAKRKGWAYSCPAGLINAKEIGSCTVKVLGPSSMVAERLEEASLQSLIRGFCVLSI
jgi:hypothetical protein